MQMYQGARIESSGEPEIKSSTNLSDTQTQINRPMYEKGAAEAHLNKHFSNSKTKHHHQRF